MRPNYSAPTIGFSIEEPESASGTLLNEIHICKTVLVQSENNDKLDLLLTNCWNLATTENHALLDTGAEGLFVDKRIAQMKRKLITPLKVRNVDGTQKEKNNFKH